jgi:hypothetical protein
MLPRSLVSLSLFFAAASNDPGVCESSVGFEQNYCQCIQLPVLYPLCCAKSGMRVGSNLFVGVDKPEAKLSCLIYAEMKRSK